MKWFEGHIIKKIKAINLTCTFTMQSSFNLFSSGGTGELEPTFPDNSALTGPPLSSYVATKKKPTDKIVSQNSPEAILRLSFYTTKTLYCDFNNFVSMLIVYLHALLSLLLHFKCILRVYTSGIVMSIAAFQIYTTFHFLISTLVLSPSTVCQTHS